MSRSSAVLSAAVLSATALLAALPAAANERHFTNSYETAVLPPGVVEIEPWTTLRLGKDRFYSAIDNRLEFEVGLSERLQTSIYLNWGTEGARDASGTVRGAPNHKGVSSEWKYKLSDSVADPVGSALYLELGLGPTEYEVEGKILLDKRSGPWNLVFNAIYEFERNEEEAIDEHKVHATAGVGYFLNDHLSLGVEAMDFNKFEPMDPGGAAVLKHGAVYAGPVLAYASHQWWVAASVTPQVFGYGKGIDSSRGLNLDDFERVQSRILVGVHL